LPAGVAAEPQAQTSAPEASWPDAAASGGRGEEGSVVYCPPSGRPDHRGARPLAPSARFPVFKLVFDGLAFLEIVKTRTFHGRMVEEDVGAIASDESKAAIGDHFLDNTLRHCNRTSLT
jgi:hypothetical protein